MKPVKIKFEDMKDLSCGDLVIMNDPLMERSIPYVFMSNVDDKSFYFINGHGASLMVNSQDTIKNFNVRLIDNTHPIWNQDLSEHGKLVGDMLKEIEE